MENVLEYAQNAMMIMRALNRSSKIVCNTGLVLRFACFNELYTCLEVLRVDNQEDFDSVVIQPHNFDQ